MGFGWLFLGYVISFLLYSVAGMLNVGFLAHAVGYLLMLRGLYELRKYRREFLLPLAVVCLLLPITVWDALRELSETFLWRLPFLTETATTVVAWVDFGLLLAFHFSLYYAISVIARSVELPRTVRDAMFDTIVGAGYAVLYIVSRLPVLASVAAQFSVPLTVFLLFWRICDLCLLISCCKNICPAGDENVAPRRYRWEFLNRLGDSFARNFHRAADSARQGYEENLRKKQERKRRK